MARRRKSSRRRSRRSRHRNPSTLVTVIVSSVSALVGAGVVHHLWKTGRIGGGETQTYQRGSLQGIDFGPYA